MIRVIVYPILLLVWADSQAIAQIVLTGSIVLRIDSLISVMPASGTGAYDMPTQQELATWAYTVDAILSGNVGQADSAASTLGYHLLAFTDNSPPSRFYCVLEENPGNGKHWGTFVFDPEPLRNLVIQSPHPRHDTNSGRQGVRIFRENGAAAFFISGAHRCNHSSCSGCSGTTTACSSTSEPYRVSDQAHVTDGTFQKTTEVMAGLNSDLFFIQVHGFTKITGDPDVIMSCGGTTPPVVDSVVTLKDNLLIQDTTLTFKIAHIDSGWTRLIATTNTQGRFLNGSPFPCTMSAPAATGRFIHIEQAFAKLRDSPQNWMKLSNAITMTFPEQPLSVELFPRSQPVGFSLSQNYPNPFNPSTTVRFSLPRPGYVSVKIFNVLGEEVATLLRSHLEAGSHAVHWDPAGHPSGVYFYRLQVGESVETKKLVLVR